MSYHPARNAGSPGYHGCNCPELTGVACLTIRSAVQLIVLSFTLIISLMIGTFTVVYKAGGVHFNE